MQKVWQAELVMKLWRMPRLELSRGMSAFFMEFSNVGLERILCVEIERNYKFIHFKS
jgi:hypothetical protein